jgi:hypothetical protein
VDDKAALAVKGVQQTVALDTFKPPHLFQPLGGVAVIANSTWSAIKGRRALKVVDQAQNLAVHRHVVGGGHRPSVPGPTLP